MSWCRHIIQRPTFVLPGSLVFAAEGWGAGAGQHRSSLCREKLGMKLKLPSKALAPALSPDPALFILLGDGDDDVSITLTITGQRGERERGGERESLPSIRHATDLPSFILPGPKCKVTASPSSHKSLLCWTERGRGRRLSQPASADERVFIDQEGERKEEEG